MSTKKVIQVNPELFKLSGGNKTRKNREKKELTLSPIIKPNVVKNTLLRRIKEHKTNEINNKKASPGTRGTSNSGTSATGNSKPANSDEFYNAINFLADLSKNKKKEARNDVIQNNAGKNKTLKTYVSSTPSIDSSINSSKETQYIPLLSSLTTASPHVELDLPFDLQEPTPLKSNFFVPQGGNVMNIKYNTNNDVPYGCLKGGSKPSYRSWIQTRKNHEQIPNLVTNINTDIAVRPPTPPKRNTFVESLNPNLNPNPNQNQNPREERLEQIKNKLKKFQENEHGTKPEYISLNNSLAKLTPFGPEGELGNSETKTT